MDGPEFSDGPPRVVVGGWAADAVGVLKSDGPAPWVQTDGGARIARIWDSSEAEEIPDGAAKPVSLPAVVPAPGQVRVVIGWFQPDADRASFGLHRTASIDVLTVLRGELVVEMEDGHEVALRPGETFVQNGAVHAVWNRRAEVAVALITMIGAA